MDMNEIEGYSGKQVLLKFKSGRTISGIVRGDRGAGFTVKLGVLYIPLTPEELVKITPLLG